jgi:hypothetical protein
VPFLYGAGKANMRCCHAFFAPERKASSTATRFLIENWNLYGSRAPGGIEPETLGL